jgi:uncharacterized membrane protein YhaH (DUF805 family)
MDYKWFLFGFEGRINRAKYWAAGLIIIGGALVLSMLLFVVAKIFGTSTPLSFAFYGHDVFRIADPASIRLAIDSLRGSDLTSTATLLPLLFRVIVTPIVVWCCAATLIKRLHDRNKSGWWIVPFFVVPSLYHQFEDRLDDTYFVAFVGLIASVLGLWCFVEIACLKGTTGPNRFGPDPLAPVDTDGHAASRWDQHDELEFVPHSAGPSPGPHVMRGHE